jgi:hypothetical protein
MAIRFKRPAAFCLPGLYRGGDHALDSSSLIPDCRNLLQIDRLFQKCFVINVLFMIHSMFIPWFDAGASEFITNRQIISQVLRH